MFFWLLPAVLPALSVSPPTLPGSGRATGWYCGVVAGPKGLAEKILWP
jgi:hypothetical protein